jgi:hypothetical protein
VGLSLGTRKSREQQRGENGNDGDDHQEFEQRKSPSMNWTRNKSSITAYGAYHRF